MPQSLFIFVVVVLFCCCFSSSSPQRNIKVQRKESNTENKSESQTKRQRGKKKGRIKEASDGPGELSSRGLGFLQRKFRYMFVCLHFQIGPVCAHSEEKNKSNANFRGGVSCGRLLAGPPGYCKQPIARCAHLLKY